MSNLDQNPLSTLLDRRTVIKGAAAAALIGLQEGAAGAATITAQPSRDWIAERLRAEKQLLIYHPAGSNFRTWLNDTVVASFQKNVSATYGVDLAVEMLSTGGGDAAFWQKMKAFKDGGGRAGEFDIDVVRIAPDFQTLDAVEAGLFLPLLPDNEAVIPNVKNANASGRATFSAAGKSYAVTFQQPTIAMFHNKEKLPNPPRKLDEILEWASKNPKRFTYEDPRGSAGIGSGTMWLMAVLKNYGDVNDPTTWSKGWDYLRKLQEFTYPQPNTGEQALELMRRGEIHLMAFWNDWGIFARETLNMPFVANYLLDSGVPIRNTPYAIPADCKHPVSALLYVDYALSPAMQIDLAKSMHQIPGNMASGVWDNIPEDAFGFKYAYIKDRTFAAFDSRKNVDAIRQMAPAWSAAVLGR